MRILMITPMLPYPEAPTAQTQVMYAQLSGLAAHHDMTLVTFGNPDAAEREAANRLRNSGITVEVVWRIPVSGISQLNRRVRLATNWLHGGRPLKVLWFWNAPMQYALDKIIRAKSFDLIQVEDNVMANYRLQTRSPRVLTEHEVRAPQPNEFDVRLLPLGDNSLISTVGPLRKIVSNAERRRWQHYQPAIWKLFDRIQVFTNRDASMIRSMTPELADRVRLNPFGVRVPPEADHSKEKPDSVIFVGMFMHPANVDAALWIANEIMPLLRRQRPGIRLQLVGGHAPASVRALASEDITVTGYVPTVRPLLEEAALVLAPVRVGGGMRMKVLEAMAMGKAVVTTPLGAEGLSFGQGELPLGISPDAEGIARIAATLLASDQARHNLGSRARAFVIQRHTWSSYIERLEATYAELRPSTAVQTDAVSTPST